MILFHVLRYKVVAWKRQVLKILNQWSKRVMNYFSVVPEGQASDLGKSRLVAHTLNQLS